MLEFLAQKAVNAGLERDFVHVAEPLCDGGAGLHAEVVAFEGSAELVKMPVLELSEQDIPHAVPGRLRCIRTIREKVDSI